MWKFLNCLMNTMQCGRLVVMLLLCGVVLGEHLLECDGVFNNQYCWNSSTYLDDYCWRCEITLNKEISDTDQMITIYSKHDDGTDAAIDTVLVYGESVTKMPNIFLKTTKKPIKDVHLRETNTKLLNAQFFGNSGIYLKTFSYQLNELSVEASAFQNCTNLEELNFIQNNISSISPDAFLGLHKLIKLNVVFSDLAVVLKDWFKDLGNLEELVLSVNQLQEVPDNCFDTLIKLKTLDLSENKIEIIRWNNFQMNEQLEKINLEYNEIKDIQMGSFEHLSKLTWLDLKLNSCVDFDFVNNTSAEIAERLTACYPTRCRIPRISNGQVVSTQDNSTQAPGVSFNPYKSVTVVCHPTFIQFHEKETQPSNLCLKDDWKSQEWPECHSK